MKQEHIDQLKALLNDIRRVARDDEPNTFGRVRSLMNLVARLPGGVPAGLRPAWAAYRSVTHDEKPQALKELVSIISSFRVDAHVDAPIIREPGEGEAVASTAEASAGT